MIYLDLNKCWHVVVQDWFGLKTKERNAILPKLQPKFAGSFPWLVYDNGTYKIAIRGPVNECRLKLLTPCANVAGQSVGAE